MSRRLHIRPRPGVNPFALLMFLLLGSGSYAKPTRAQPRQEHPDGAKTILRSELELGKNVGFFPNEEYPD